MTRRTFLLAAAALRIPDGFVHLPAGPFTMGFGNTRHTVRLTDFYIAKHLVTNAEFKQFREATSTQPPSYWSNAAFNWQEKANHPVLWVGYDHAIAYCQWLSAKTGVNFTLPSEAQWERAARGATKTGEENQYPWGNATAPDDYEKRLNYNVLCAVKNGIPKTIAGREYPHWPFVVEKRGQSAMAANFKAVVYAEEDERTPDILEASDEVKAVWKQIMARGGYTTPVGSYPAGPEGCFDMAGNAFEWTRDYYSLDHYRKLAETTVDPCVENPAALTPQDIQSGSDGQRGGGRPTKIIRGGSWYANQGSCRTYLRTETRAAGRSGYHSVGFRIVATVKT